MYNSITNFYNFWFLEKKIWKEDIISSDFFCRMCNLLSDNEFFTQTSEVWRREPMPTSHFILILYLHYLFDVSEIGIYLTEIPDIWLNNSNKAFYH